MGQTKKDAHPSVCARISRLRRFRRLPGNPTPCGFQQAAPRKATQGLGLDIEGETVNAMVKNIDYDPMSKKVLALDFQALVAGEKVSTTVAVKLEHTDMVQGIVEQEMEEIHYKADPSNLLDTIVIDFNGYPADVRDIHVKDLPIPEGKHVHFITPEDAVVVHIGEYEAAPEEDEDAEGAEAEAK